MREEILDSWAHGEAEPFAVVTRNTMGCEVLNTADIMCIDIDTPEGKPPTIGFFARLLGKTPPPPPPSVEEETLKKVEHMVTRDSSCGIRVYRTAAGLRLLLTHSRVTPEAPDTLDAMRAFSADPRYMNLCKLQECFRARLTPKPWRCGSPNCEVRYPYEHDDAEEAMEFWVACYNQAAERYATCALIGQYGSQSMDADIQRVVDYHDQRTGVTTGLPLA